MPRRRLLSRRHWPSPGTAGNRHRHSVRPRWPHGGVGRRCALHRAHDSRRSRCALRLRPSPSSAACRDGRPRSPRTSDPAGLRWQKSPHASTPIASMVSMVSRSDSPFLTEEVLTLKFMVSAESRFAAVSKLSRVRVESSKKSDTTVRPRSAGTLGMVRSLTSTKESVSVITSLMPAATSGPRSAIARRLRMLPCRGFVTGRLT